MFITKTVLILNGLQFNRFVQVQVISSRLPSVSVSAFSVSLNGEKVFMTSSLPSDANRREKLEKLAFVEMTEKL